jgi:hypothetical protein
MTISGLRSQEALENKVTTKCINAVERDSIFKKIQRGKIDAVRVVLLDSALAACGSAKKATFEAYKLEEKRVALLEVVIATERKKIGNLDKLIKLEVKKRKKKAFWNFIKGSVLGAAIVSILGFII